MKIIQALSMDFSMPGIKQKIYAKQDDSGGLRSVAIDLYNSGLAYPVSNDTGFMLRYKTAAGAIGLYDTMPDGSSAFLVENNRVTISLVDQIFAAAGVVECDLRIIEANGAISTWSWDIVVEKSNGGDATIPSDYINALAGYASSAIASAAKAKEYAESLDPTSLMKLQDYDPSGQVISVGGIEAFVNRKSTPVLVEDVSFSCDTQDKEITYQIATAYKLGKTIFISGCLTLKYVKDGYANEFSFSLSSESTTFDGLVLPHINVSGHMASAGGGVISSASVHCSASANTVDFIVVPTTLPSTVTTEDYVQFSVSLLATVA